MEATLNAIGTNSGGLGWIVEPTYVLSQYTWRVLLTQFLPRELVARVSRSEHAIDLVNGGRIEFKTAEYPERLVAVSLDWLWVNEPQLIDDSVWLDSLRPRLFDKQAPAWFTGTPRGRNWFFDLYRRGQDKLEPEYESWRFPTWTNPYIPPPEIEKARHEMPERIFRQNIGAEFLEDAASVFRSVDALSIEQPQEPEKNARYIIGLDIARTHDYSVASVVKLPKLSEPLVQVFLDRYHRVDWGLQEQRVKVLSQRFNDAALCMDATGVGDPELERLRRLGLQVTGIKFASAAIKANVVENLAMLMERGQLKLLANEVQKAELKNFEYSLLPSATVRYGGRGDAHDDTVIGLALAGWGATHRVTVEAEQYMPFARL